MTPEEYCQQKAAQSGSSFYYSFMFLPEERRRAITALYAFCREVDDAVDEPGDPQVARAKLDWWRKEVAQLYAGNAQHPVSKALVPAIGPFNIQQHQLGAIMDGMEMDLTQTRYPDFRSLQLYCHRVAGVVGLLAASIFGYRNPKTLEYAENLGLAFQLTNIIRDVGEDARKDRIYLPADEMQRFGVSEAQILGSQHTEGFSRLIQFQAQRVQSCYADALALLPAEDRRAQRPGLVMAAIYRTLLEEIGRDGYQVLTRRTRLTPIRKLWIAWKTWVTA
jgi:15-cis-phytoene synthase